MKKIGLSSAVHPFKPRGELLSRQDLLKKINSLSGWLFSNCEELRTCWSVILLVLDELKVARVFCLEGKLLEAKIGFERCLGNLTSYGKAEFYEPIMISDEWKRSARELIECFHRVNVLGVRSLFEVYYYDEQYLYHCTRLGNVSRVGTWKHVMDTCHSGRVNSKVKNELTGKKRGVIDVNVDIVYIWLEMARPVVIELEHLLFCYIGLMEKVNSMFIDSKPRPGLRELLDDFIGNIRSLVNKILKPSNGELEELVKRHFLDTNVYRADRTFGPTFEEVSSALELLTGKLSNDLVSLADLVQFSVKDTVAFVEEGRPLSDKTLVLLSSTKDISDKLLASESVPPSQESIIHQRILKCEEVLAAPPKSRKLLFLWDFNKIENLRTDYGADDDDLDYWLDGNPSDAAEYAISKYFITQSPRTGFKAFNCANQLQGICDMKASECSSFHLTEENKALRLFWIERMHKKIHDRKDRIMRLYFVDAENDRFHNAGPLIVDHVPEDPEFFIISGNPYSNHRIDLAVRRSADKDFTAYIPITLILKDAADQELTREIYYWDSILDEHVEFVICSSDSFALHIWAAISDKRKCRVLAKYAQMEAKPVSLTWENTYNSLIKKIVPYLRYRETCTLRELETCVRTTEIEMLHHVSLRKFCSHPLVKYLYGVAVVDETVNLPPRPFDKCICLDRKGFPCREARRPGSGHFTCVNH